MPDEIRTSIALWAVVASAGRIPVSFSSNCLPNWSGAAVDGLVGGVVGGVTGGVVGGVEGALGVRHYRHRYYRRRC
jgi:hypothetical protein